MVETNRTFLGRPTAAVEALAPSSATGISSCPPPTPLVCHHRPLLSISSAFAPHPLSPTAVVPSAATINTTLPSHRVTRLPAAATESSPLICHHCHLLPMTYISSFTKAVIISRPPRAGHLSPLLLSPLVHRRRPLSSAVTASPLLPTARLPTLPYIVADCQVVACSGNHHAISEASVCGIGTRGPFLPAVAMVVMVVVVGLWRLRGTIQFFEVCFFLRKSLGKCLIAGLITRALARNCTLKL